MLKSRTIMVVLAVLAVATGASAQTSAPTFAKTFIPNTIGPGSISTLRFDITSSGTVGARDLAFTDNLPAGVTVASPAQVVSTCGGTVTAVSGGGTIGFSGGSVGAGRSCRVTVDVTSSTPGTHNNVSGDLTSDQGNSGSASASLTVSTDRPGFTKSFSPSSVSLGGRSTLTLTIDNSANSSQIFNKRVTDNLPSGMVVASPTNASTTCTGTAVTAVAGGSSISVSPNLVTPDFLAAGATCTVSVDVLGNATGPLGNTTGELTSQSTTNPSLLSSGKAGAVLTVTTDRISLTKTFTDDPVPPGGTVTLRFTLRNLDRSATATSISFTDDLDAALSGLASTSGAVSACGGSISGTSTLSFSGGTLGSGGSCTFSVSLQVPSTAPAGSYTNTTSTVSADLDGLPTAGAAASDLLVVEATPLLTKSFIDDPTGAGGTVTLEFSITNTSPDFEATDLAFQDVFDVVMPTASSVPAAGFCGPSSTATFFPLTNPPPPSDATPARLVISGASLAAGATCTFSIVLDVSVGAAVGTYPNTTSTITGTVNGEAVTGNPASDDLNVLAAPALVKEFIDDPVIAGDPVTLQFTLTHDELNTAPATGISFTDDLEATLSGLVSTSGTVSACGGSITGTSTLSFTGGTLNPGESCTFSVTLSTPSTAPAGIHTNTTSTVVATVDTLQVLSNAASDDLVIAGLVLSKEFIGDPVLPGSSVILRFTIDNISPVSTATEIFFRDDLSVVLSGLAATGTPPTDPCGTGSTLTYLSANRLIIFDHGTLAPLTSCSFDVPLSVPSGAASDDYANQTSAFSADVEGTTVFFVNASDQLSVNNNLLALSKEFTNDPVRPGGTVSLEFTITNLNDFEAISSIAFTDDLDAALSGLVSLSGTLADVCGLGSQITGTGFLSFTGGSLPAGGTCTFNVVVEVPSTTTRGTLVTNTTSEVTGDVGGIPVRGDAASADLQVDALDFSKSFSGIANPGGTVSLLFQIESASGTATFESLEFSDDLDAVIPGLTAVGLPLTDVCGTGSSISGTSVLTFEGGTVLPGGSCSFSVTLQVPVTATAGSFVNFTTDLTEDGLSTAAPATATLVVVAVVDEDGDDVLDGDDLCPGTVIPESVPTRSLGVNRYALVDGDTTFDTLAPRGRGQGPGDVFTTTDTGGCSCEQIIEALGLGNGHTKFGCSLSAMRDWSSMVSTAGSFEEILQRPYQDDDELGGARRLGGDQP